MELLKIIIVKKQIKVNTSNGVATIKLNDIIYCEASDVHVQIPCYSKKIVTRSSLKDFLLILDDNFIQIHP
jgi:DNA-binding LytR/AlgR family response regulator